jgi:hypothetical protein
MSVMAMFRQFVDEQVYRSKNRAIKDKPITDADRFELALSQVARKRLTYAEVTGKVEETRSLTLIGRSAGSAFLSRLFKALGGVRYASQRKRGTRACQSRPVYNVTAS